MAGKKGKGGGGGGGQSDQSAMTLPAAGSVPAMPSFPATGDQGSNAFGTGDLVPKSINVDVPVAIQAVLPPGFHGGTAWSRTTFIMPIDTAATQSVMEKRLDLAAAIEIWKERLNNALATIKELRDRLASGGDQQS